MAKLVARYRKPVDAIQRALASPEGQATAGDLANFAPAGVVLLVFANRDV